MENHIYLASKISVVINPLIGLTEVLKNLRKIIHSTIPSDSLGVRGPNVDFKYHARILY